MNANTVCLRIKSDIEICVRYHGYAAVATNKLDLFHISDIAFLLQLKAITMPRYIQ